MRERDWTNATPAPGDMIEAPGVTVTCGAAGGATLISGDLGKGLARLTPDAPILGLLDMLPETGAFALRIARDRALLCTAEPLGTTNGWHDGYALSAADDLYLPMEIEDADGHLRAACMSTPAGSPSAMTLFAEKPCLVARTGAGLRVWVQLPDLAEVWARLVLLSRA